MSNAYYLCVEPSESTWHLDLDEFETSLRNRWPHAEIELNETDVRAVAWSLRPSHDVWLDGEMRRDGVASSFRGAPLLIVEYVLWFREHYPEPGLVFVHDADGTLWPVTPTMTREDVLAIL